MIDPAQDDAMTSVAVRTAGLVEALRRVGGLVVFGLVPMLLAITALASMTDVGNEFGFDFRGGLWEPAGRLLDGEHIFPAATHEAMLVGNPSIYPPFPVVAVTPLGLLPFDVASLVWAALLVVAVVVSLRAVGVRDWRCHALAVSSPPVLHGLYFGNLTLVLLVSIALAWRWREMPLRGGTALAAGIAVKLLLWPMLGWLVVSRRLHAAAIAIGGTFLALAGSWAVIRFEGLTRYPALLDALEDVYSQWGFSLPTALGSWASSSAVRAAACLAALAALSAAAIALSKRADGERRTLTVFVAASILASPIVWPNYFTLLLVPLGIARSRVTALWFVPYLLWLPLAIDDRQLRASGCLVWMLCFVALLLRSRTTAERASAIGPTPSPVLVGGLGR